MSSAQKEYLQRIAEEAAFITAQTTGISLLDLQQNIVLQRALAWSLEVMGKSAEHLDKAFTQKHSKIDWQTFISAKDSLQQNSFHINLPLLFNACQQIPKHLTEIENIINKEENVHQ